MKFREETLDVEQLLDYVCLPGDERERERKKIVRENDNE